MKKSRLFIENMIVYGVGQVIAKIIPFIMLPIITRLMPDSYYMGINDMNVLVVSFGSQIAIMGMYDAMFRMYFDKTDKRYHKEVCSTALGNVLAFSIVIFMILLLLRETFSQWIFNDKSLSMLLIISALNIVSDSLKLIIAAPTRILNKRKVFLIINTIFPIISYSISVPLLIMGNYLFALPIASLIASLSMLMIFWILNKKFFNLKYMNGRLLKQLLKIGVPLMPTFLIYWIFSSFDRVMILKMLGAGAAGIYAVGNKVSMISQLLYQAFAGGWGYFSFSTMKDRNQVITNTKIFNYLSAISFVSYAFMILFSNFLFKLLFIGDYVKASIVFPYLFLSPLLLMLFQILSNQFIIIKKSYLVTGSLITGAVLNVILNYILIPIFNIEGAAIATVIGYLISLIIAMVLAQKRGLFIFTRKFNISFLLLIILIGLSILKNTILLNLFSITYIALILLLYKNDFVDLLKNIRKR